MLVRDRNRVQLPQIHAIVDVDHGEAVKRPSLGVGQEVLARGSLLQAKDDVVAVSDQLLGLLLVHLLNDHNISGRIGNVPLLLVPKQVVLHLVSVGAGEELL